MSVTFGAPPSVSRLTPRSTFPREGGRLRKKLAVAFLSNLLPSRGKVLSVARRKGARAAILLLALLFATPAFAVDVQTLPAPRGDQIWYVSDHTLPMIAMTAAIPAGSSYDPQGKEGLATFAASLLDEGAGHLNSDAFHTALATRAIKLSVSPDRDYLIVQLVSLTENAKDAYRLLGEALAHPRFDADAIQRVRAQILSTIAQEDEDPSGVAIKAFFQTYFHDHPYAHPTGGTAAGIGAINANDLKAFAATHWVNAGLKIAVSGDVDPATLSRLLKSAFGGLPTKAPAEPAMATHVGQPGVQVIAMDVPQPTVVFGMPGFLRTDRDFLAGYIANYIVGGGGFSSRLTDQVREQRGLTYDISTSLDDYRKAGVLAGQVANETRQRETDHRCHPPDLARLRSERPDRQGTDGREDLYHRLVPARLQLECRHRGANSTASSARASRSII